MTPTPDDSAPSPFQPHPLEPRIRAALGRVPGGAQLSLPELEGVTATGEQVNAWLQWCGAEDGAGDAAGVPYQGGSLDLGRVLAAIVLWAPARVTAEDLAQRLWSQWVDPYEKAARRRHPGLPNMTAEQLQQYVRASWLEALDRPQYRDALLAAIPDQAPISHRPRPRT